MMTWKRMVMNIKQCLDCAWVEVKGRPIDRPLCRYGGYEKTIENVDEIPVWCELEDYEEHPK